MGSIHISCSAFRRKTAAVSRDDVAETGKSNYYA